MNNIILIMSLATHIVFGAAITIPFVETYNPFVIFIAAFFSHFIIDSVPHFDYKLKSLNKSKKEGVTIKRNYKLITKDLFYILSDISIGSVILLLIYSLGDIKFSIIMFAVIIVGSILPDALQVPYWLFKDSPIKHLQKFHETIHAKKRIKSPIIGIASQTTIITLLVYLIIF